MEAQALNEQTDLIKGLWDTPIVCAATPIGNLGDVTLRLLSLFRTATMIACEDTRVTRRLLQALELKTSALLISVHAHNEERRSADIIEAAHRGERILMVSDAGTPAVSDPGALVLRRAVEAGIAVTMAPGASAVTTAVVLSGLDSRAFGFAGFYPRAHKDQQRFIQRLHTETWTTVFFESPHRLAATLTQLAEHFPHREAAVARELTKKFEEVLRADLQQLAQSITARHRQSGIKGECAVVLAGVNPETVDPGTQAVPAATAEQLARTALELAAEGTRLKDAVKSQVHGTRFSAREVYDLALQLREV